MQLLLAFFACVVTLAAKDTLSDELRHADSEINGNVVTSAENARGELHLSTHVSRAEVW